MIRWLRVFAAWSAILALISLGIVLGLFLVANGKWIPVAMPPWLADYVGNKPQEVWLPALLAGWLVAMLCAAALLGLSMYYVWRRRQADALIGKLERELAHLRNLPFDAPAPFEDLPELPNVTAAQVMATFDEDVA